MQRMSDPSYLATMTMSQLYDIVYESRLPIIDDLLYPGTYLFVGAPKVGKSFLMAQTPCTSQLVPNSLVQGCMNSWLALHQSTEIPD